MILLPEKRSILVVDDQSEVRDLIGAIVVSLELAIHEAKDGEAALQAVRKRSFDVIVTDQDMPNMTGTAFRQAACELRPELSGKFIFITGGRHAELLRIDCPILRKPFRPIELLDLVKQVLHVRDRQINT